MQSNREEVFDWAATEWPTPQSTQPLAVYQPQPITPPIARVVQPEYGTPYYAHVPAQVPAYDPIPARRMATAALVLAGGVSLSLVEVASWVFFKGLSMADHALMSLGLVLLAGTGLALATKSGGTVTIKNFHQGDNSSFSVGGKR